MAAPAAPLPRLSYRANKTICLALPKIIKSLPISDSITSAVLRHEGQEGANLAAVLAYENSDWDALRSMNHSPKTITKIYLQSLKWAEEATMIFKEDEKKKAGTIELKKL